MEELDKSVTHKFCKALYIAEKKKVRNMLVYLEMMLDDYLPNPNLESILAELTQKIDDLVEEIKNEEC